jgi:glutamate-1-semialdehyde 2,1-aminomutase
VKPGREKSQALFERASKVLPRGVSSNFRYWSEDDTPMIARAEGGYIWDMDGKRYIDYRLGFGPVILGHANPEVDAYVSEALKDGVVYACTTEREVRVAEKIVAMCPGVDMVRFANSGSEATMHALRVARAYTGRDKIIKFEGHYHGMYDYVLWSTASSTMEISVMGNPRSPIPVCSSSGIPRAIRDLVIPIPYNDIEILEETIRRTWFDVAGIIMEPMMGNVGSIEIDPAFLQRMRELCDEYGIVFIMDEVKTGFRVGKGGAQELYGVMPDLATYAKAIGNGYPVAAFGGKREIMNIIGHGVAHGGTYAANNVGMAAAEKTLEILSTTDALEQVAERGRELQKGISDILETRGIPFVMTGHPSMFGVHFAEQTPKSYRDYLASDYGTYNAILEELVVRGAMPDPDSREPWFISSAHTPADVADTLTMFEESVKAVLGGG